MRVLSNHPEPALLRGVAAMLVQALASAPGEVWLISPWLKDVALPTATAGSFRPELGGDPDHLPLSDLLERAARRHTLHLVTKPPAELVDLGALKRIAEKMEVRRHLLAEEELRGYAVVEDMVADIDADVRRLAESAARHAETLRLGQRLLARRARVYFLRRLHAKILWTPQAALVGSANFTNGGLMTNDELMLEVTDAEAHEALLAAARALGTRAVATERYSLVPEFVRAGLVVETVAGWMTPARADDPPQLSDVARLLAPYLCSGRG